MRATDAEAALAKITAEAAAMRTVIDGVRTWLRERPVIVDGWQKRGRRTSEEVLAELDSLLVTTAGAALAARVVLLEKVAEAARWIAAYNQHNGTYDDLRKSLAALDNAPGGKP